MAVPSPFSLPGSNLGFQNLARAGRRHRQDQQL